MTPVGPSTVGDRSEGQDDYPGWHSHEQPPLTIKDGKWTHHYGHDNECTIVYESEPAWSKIKRRVGELLGTNREAWKVYRSVDNLRSSFDAEGNRRAVNDILNQVSSTEVRKALLEVFEMLLKAEQASAIQSGALGTQCNVAVIYSEAVSNLGQQSSGAVVTSASTDRGSG